MVGFMGMFFILFHAIGMISLSFGLVLLIVYMAKYTKKETLFNVSVGVIVVGLIFSVLTLGVFALVGGSEGSSMMDGFSERSFNMMNWDNDETESSTTESTRI